MYTPMNICYRKSLEFERGRGTLEELEKREGGIKMMEI